MSPSKTGLFCSKPFRWFEVFQGAEIGDVYLCSAAWMDKIVGNIQHLTLEQIWNGEEAQEIRQSILDGSFRFCNSRCPFVQTVSQPVQRIEDITDQESKTVIEKKLTRLPYGPRSVNCSFDMSCNLACPSCRSRVIIEHERKGQIQEIQRWIWEEALRDAHLNWFWGLTPSCLMSLLETVGCKVDFCAKEGFAKMVICTAVDVPFVHRLPDETEARKMGETISATARLLPS